VGGIRDPKTSPQNKKTRAGAGLTKKDSTRRVSFRCVGGGVWDTNEIMNNVRTGVA